MEKPVLNTATLKASSGYDNVENSRKLAAALDQLSVQKNTITEAAFAKFLPIFELAGTTPNSQDHIQRGIDLRPLMTEYYQTIDTYAPVRVVRYDGSVIFELPPVYDEVPTINSATPNSNIITDSLAGALHRATPLSTEEFQALRLYVKALQKATDGTSVKERANSFAGYMEKLAADREPTAIESMAPAEKGADVRISSANMNDFE